MLIMYHGEALKYYTDKSNINVTRLAKLLDVDRTQVYQLFKAKKFKEDTYNNVIEKIPEFESITLLDKNQVHKNETSGYAIIQYYENADAICGIADYKNLQEQTSYPISVPGAREGDFCINAKGQSLSGIIESGTIIGLRPVTDYDLIVYGELYFVCTEAFERAKIIMPGVDKKHIILKSTDDDKFPPIEIPKSKITALYKIWYKGELL